MGSPADVILSSANTTMSISRCPNCHQPVRSLDPSCGKCGHHDYVRVLHTLTIGCAVVATTMLVGFVWWSRTFNP
jgi:hypothetical protein